ncbi:MAG: hypothetical protein AAF219_10145 [Myxococcota bacterium]
MPKHTEAYVLGLLAEADDEVPRLESELARARARAAAVDGELSSLLQRLDGTKVALREAERLRSRSAQALTDGNMRIASLHQEIAGLGRRAEDIKTEMERVGPGAIARRLRRDRAKLRVQIQDREVEVQALRDRGETSRMDLQRAELSINEEKDRARIITIELDQLQSRLPDPHQLARLVESRLGRAHCELVLGQDQAGWSREVEDAVELAFELHEDLRKGKYRLDTNSELIGGRSMASAESMFALVAMEQDERALEFFELVTDPALYFHQILNVFRVWCLGHYLRGERKRLLELLRMHQYDEGIRAGYVQAFIGLLTDEADLVGKGVTRVVRHEWDLWADPKRVRSAGAVNMGAVALCRLAIARGMRVPRPGPTVPRVLFQKRLSA